MQEIERLASIVPSISRRCDLQALGVTKRHQEILLAELPYSFQNSFFHLNIDECLEGALFACRLTSCFGIDPSSSRYSGEGQGDELLVKGSHTYHCCDEASCLLDRRASGNQVNRLLL